MFEVRIPVNVPISINLREFILQYFEPDGPPECQIQDIEEYAASLSRADLLATLEAIRAKYGNLWLRRETCG